MANERLIKAFRNLSAIVYITNILCSVIFAWYMTYLHLCVGSLAAAMSLFMLIIATQTPKMLTGALELSHRALFTWRGRFTTDILISLLLFAMGTFGITMGIITIFISLSIRSLGNRDKETFQVLFPTTKDPSTNNTEGSDYNLA
mmetsp:Transcript_30550/g.46870  ORF Transcript_30550/g.46870 Transcript_30550/m.46870 type:complete len:145 (+) Transcript_30550:145-579(+)